MAKLINVSKLHQELENADIHISGCDSGGVVLDIDGNQIQDREDVKSIISAHDPAPYQESVIRQRYAEVGVDAYSMVFALWKKVMASDSTDADALQSLMDGIDASIN